MSMKRDDAQVTRTPMRVRYLGRSTGFGGARTFSMRRQGRDRSGVGERRERLPNDVHLLQYEGQ